MATSRIELATTAAPPRAGMDRPASRKRWSPSGWPLPAKLAAAVLGLAVAVLVIVRILAGTGRSTLRLPKAQLTVATVEQGIFHDLIALRARVEPRETVYIDA